MSGRKYCAAVLHWWWGEVIQRYEKFPTMQIIGKLFWKQNGWENSALSYTWVSNVQTCPRRTTFPDNWMHWANPSKLNVKDCQGTYLYYMRAWGMHPFELASCMWYSLCYMYTAWDAHMCPMMSHAKPSHLSKFLKYWFVNHLLWFAFLAIITFWLPWEVTFPLEALSISRQRPRCWRWAVCAEGSHIDSKTDLSNLSIPGFLDLLRVWAWFTVLSAWLFECDCETG